MSASYQNAGRVCLAPWLAAARHAGRKQCTPSRRTIQNFHTYSLLRRPVASEREKPSISQRTWVDQRRMRQVRRLDASYGRVPAGPGTVSSREKKIIIPIAVRPCMA